MGPVAKPKNAAKPRAMPKKALAAAIAVLGLLALAAFVFADWYVAMPDDVKAQYVGRNQCVSCHQQEHQAWQGSDHDLAMDRATEETVLGDFSDVEFTHHDVTSRLYRDGEKYMIRTEGPDGELGDFEIKYVFGVRPLQQYMVEFDRAADMPENEIARLQVLRISWDTEKRSWFYLPPPDVAEKLEPDDDLHWTGLAQRWNTMCADCHSTNLHKNYDVAAGQYHTTFTDIDVSCEACHGPGSVHVELAEARSLFWDRKKGYGLAHLKAAASTTEIQSCAPCHSRRRITHPDYRPGEDYYDFFANELLQPNTYHADGQILDEVYVYGSFIQSKMYHKNIRCTDCHDPHTAKLKHQGNNLCTSCHQHPVAKYDTPAHHQHQTGSAGASCVACHMPETTYMEVDPRRDHSLRSPRPDLSLSLGVPNACTGCHLSDAKLPTEKRKELKQYADWLLAARSGDEEVAGALDRLNQWAHKSMIGWYGEPKSDTPGEKLTAALTAARADEESAVPQLEQIAKDRKLPGIWRASALAELTRFAPASPGEPFKPSDSARKLLTDKDPQVRMAAIGAYEPIIPSSNGQPIPENQLDGYAKATRPLFRDLFPLLSDPVRSVRIEAARVLSCAAPEMFGKVANGRERKAYHAAVDEYVDSLMTVSDRGGAFLALGTLRESQGDEDAAIDAYKTAIHVQPNRPGARSNLAAIYDRRREKADREARQAAMQRDRPTVERLAHVVADNAVAAEEMRRQELPLLAREARLAPNIARLQHRYSFALYLTGDLEGAEKAMRQAYTLEPTNPEYVLGLALLYQKMERFPEALRLTSDLLELVPEENPSYRSYQLMYEELKQSAVKP